MVHFHVDDYSRFALAMEVMESQETETVTQVLEKLFHQYGVPKEILTDNFHTFTSVRDKGCHPFLAFCQSHDVTHLLTPPYYPEANGKAEALIKTVKRECLADFDLSLTDRFLFEHKMDQFLKYYNWHRLHSGLSYDVPSAFYCGVRLKSSFLALPQLEGISLPGCTMPENAPRIDIAFIHRHTALVPVETNFSNI